MSTNTNNNNPHDSGVASSITTTTASNDEEEGVVEDEEEEDHSSSDSDSTTASPARLILLQIADVEDEAEEEAEEDIVTRIRRGGWTLPPVLDRYSWRRDDTARNHDLLLARAAAINRLARYVDQIISELLRQNPELRHPQERSDNAEEKEEDERR